MEWSKNSAAHSMFWTDMLGISSRGEPRSNRTFGRSFLRPGTRGKSIRLFVTRHQRKAGFAFTLCRSREFPRSRTEWQSAVAVTAPPKQKFLINSEEYNLKYEREYTTIKKICKDLEPM